MLLFSQISDITLSSILLLLFPQRTTSRTCLCPAVSTRSPVLCGDLWEILSLPAMKMERSTSSAPRWEQTGTSSTGRTLSRFGFELIYRASALGTVWRYSEEGEGAQPANQRHPNVRGSHHVHHRLQGQHRQGSPPASVFDCDWIQTRRSLSACFSLSCLIPILWTTSSLSRRRDPSTLPPSLLLWIT